MFDLTSKKAIITGASGDLGYAIAKGICDQGADIVILDVHPDTEKIAEGVNGKGRSLGIRTDLSNRQQSECAFNQAVEFLGGLDILINCAGLNIRHPAEEFTDEDWDKIIEVNLNAAFFMCRRAAKIMIEQRSGKIINVASVNSFIGGYNNCAYVASKGGLGQITKTMSNEWGQYNINVNGIAPGYMRTKMNDYYFVTEAGRELQKVMMSRVPLGRWGKPEDLVGAAIFLSSSASDFVSGTILPVDGGFLGR